MPSPVVTPSALRGVLRRRSIGVAFQPLWDLRQGTVFGYEALARFPEHGPAAWFSVAREAGLEVQLNRLTCSYAIEHFAPLAQWAPSALLFINASTPTSAIELGGIAARSPFADRIVIEMTEELIAQAQDLVYVVQELRGAGLRLAIDDMGSGQSDPHRFHLLAPEVMKLDRRLVMRFLAGQKQARSAVAEYVRLAESAGCYVLAEGIEQEQWLGKLSDHGVSLAQGYVLGRPAPVDRWVGSVHQRAAMSGPLGEGPGQPRIPPALEEAGALWIGEHRREIIARLVELAGGLRVDEPLYEQILDIIQEGLTPGSWRYGLSPLLVRRVAAMEAPPSVIVQTFVWLRQILRETLLPEGRTEADRPKMDRVFELSAWLDGIHLAVQRQRQRLAVQAEAFHREELDRRAQQTSLLREMLGNLSDGRMEQWSPRRATEIVGADGAAVVLHRPGREHSVFVYPENGGTVREATEAWLRRTAGEMGSSFQRRVAGGMRRLHGPYSSMMAAQITFEGERVGVLLAWRREAVRFTRRDEEAFILLASQIGAVAHAQSRLTDIVRREHELLSIEEVTSGLADARTPEDAAGAVLTAVQVLLSADRYFLLINGEKRLREVAALPQGGMRGPSRDTLNAVARWVAEHDEPLFLRDGEAPVHAFGQRPLIAEGDRTRSLAAAPLQLDGATFGILGVASETPLQFEARAVEVLERMAGLFALAYRRVGARASELGD